MEDNLRSVRLRKEVGGTSYEGVYLSLLCIAGGHNDNRNQRQLLVGFYRIQEGVSVHNRHLDVQENKGYVIRVIL